MKSRTKRVLRFLEEKKEALKTKDEGEILEMRKEFNELHKNYYEPEFEEEVKKIGWTKVLDESKERGEERFNGLIPEECWDDLR